MLGPLLLGVGGPPVPTENVSVVFWHGSPDQGGHYWGCIRGPAIVRAPNQSLLAFAYGLPGGCHPDIQYGDVMLFSHSEDDGVTWSQMREITRPNATKNVVYASPVVDVQKGVVHLLYNRQISETWRISSTDNGATWSAPVNHTAQLGPLCIGPPGGVQLPSGRLVSAAHRCDGGGCLNLAFYSDDHAESWKLGAAVESSAPITSLTESQLIDDGRSSTSLSLFMRANSDNPLANHALATSDDGGETWSRATLLSALVGPSCQGSIARRPGGGLLLSAPCSRDAGIGGRQNLTVWSMDQAADGTVAVADATVIWAMPAAYSSLLTDASGRTFASWEGGSGDRYATVKFAQFAAWRS